MIILFEDLNFVLKAGALQNGIVHTAKIIRASCQMRTGIKLGDTMMVMSIQIVMSAKQNVRKIKIVPELNVIPN